MMFFKQQFKLQHKDTLTMHLDNKRLKGSSNDASTLVQTACINYLNSTKIGATIVWSDLLSYIAEQVDLISIKSLFIGRTANPTKTDDIELTPTEKAVATTTGVIVNNSPIVTGKQIGRAHV